MLKLYYMFWSDVILTPRQNGNFTDKWKEFKYYIPVFQGLNLAFIVICSKVLFDIDIWFTNEIDIFPGKKLDSALLGIISFFLPFFILNYFLIFRNNRYEKIIVNYKCYNGKLLFWYIVLSILIFFVPIILDKLFNLRGL
jgi:hypothetical protein